jgi:hypothetical protein
MGEIDLTFGHRAQNRESDMLAEDSAHLFGISAGRGGPTDTAQNPQ